ncbi:MAG: peptidoglycan-associated lipoprotein Pal [Gemmatimonadales bacterium]
MRISHQFMMVAAVALVASACGKKEPVEQPMPAVDTAAQNAAMRARQDSIDAANRARAEAERRAREEAERRAAAEAARLRDALMADMTSRIHFDFDKSDIMAGDMSNLDRKAAILMANPDLRIRIAGNCDERGSDEYNLALGNRRAAAAKRYLVNKGVSADRIETISYGEERPVAMGQTEDAWAQNRRDDFEITAGGATLAAPR